MSKETLIITLLLFLLGSNLWLWYSSSQKKAAAEETHQVSSPSQKTEGHHSDGEEVELVKLMGDLQLYSHKLGLSIQANNPELTHFYHHEMEETAETIHKAVPEYDGFPIGQLTGSMAIPQLETLEKAIEGKKWPEINAAYDQLLNSCNACHQATDHGYIVITKPSNNPFNQKF